MTKEDFYNMVVEAYRPAKSLIGMVPEDRLGWAPGARFMTLGQLICHLSLGLGDGIRTLHTGQWPTGEEMLTGMKQENLPSCDVAEALKKLEADKSALREALDALSERDFAEKVVSVPWGMNGKFEILALSFLEHFTNHKMQLFTYLKLLDLPVDTQTLYFGS
ncbi:MAG TPA: DinB family protein [Terriglobia bacterium]|nr:DinB family protein [Terriglobia bacterium]